MSRGLAILLFFCLSAKVQAQSRLYDQYVTNNYLINPALTGIEKYAELQTGYRSQWNAMEGGPTTLFVSGHGSLTRKGKKMGFTEMPVEEANTSYNLKNFGYKSQHGVGGMVTQENIGPFSSTEISGSYAFHMPVSNKWMFAVGAGIGMKFNSLRTDKVVTGVSADPLVLDFGTQTSNLLRLGVWLYSKKMFLGVSQHNSFSEIHAADGKTYFVSAGLNLKNYYGNWTFTPFTLLRLYGSSQMAELGLKLYHNQRLWFGSAYRTTRAATFFFGINFSPLLSASYAFNLQTHQNPVSNLSTVEVGLQLRLNNKQRVLCPQYLW